MKLGIIHKIKTDLKNSDMAHIKEKRILDFFKDKPNIKVVSIKTSSSIFEAKVDGSIHKFFQTLKNSLHSVGGITNRQFFKNFSGTYFFLDNSEEIDLIIIYDQSLNDPNELQFKVRIKKLLGLKTEIEFGDFFAFAKRLEYASRIIKENQLFGNYYKSKLPLKN
jgi:hypothetical protein